MPQILRPEYLPALVKVSSTQIKLPSGAYFNLGGQQYRTTSDLFLSLTMSANTLYMVYLVLSGGVPALAYSTNANSVGPAGYSLWKLAGAFYADGSASPVFGSFVNIEGVPSTSVISYNPSTTPTNTTINFAKYCRCGDSIRIHIGWNVTNTLTSVVATNAQVIPANLTGVPSVAGRIVIGEAINNNPNTGARSAGLMWRADLSDFSVYPDANAGTPNFSSNPVNGDLLTFVIHPIVISGWSNTPLKYL